MTHFTWSVSIVVPAADRVDANKLACALGRDAAWPGNTFIVPLSADGQAPATHYGCHGWDNGGLVAILQSAQDGTLPAGIDWSEFELSVPRIAELVAAMTVAIQENAAADDTFGVVMAAAGVQRVETNA